MSVGFASDGNDWSFYFLESLDLALTNLVMDSRTDIRCWKVFLV